MPSAEKLSADFGRFMAMFIGPRHSGKTVAECSFPKPALVLDFDLRIKGILGASWIDKKGIEYEQFTPRVGTNAKAQSTYEKLNNRLDILLMDLENHKCPYQTLVLDSLTSQTFAFICDALPMTHSMGEKGTANRGRHIGGMRIPGPDDYNYESIGTHQLLAYLRSLPIPNIIVSAHVVPTFGKEDPENPMSNTVEIGETLALRPKIGATAGIYFDHIFRFNRQWIANKEKFTVQFRGELANTSWSELPNEADITGKDFYNEVLMKYIKDKKEKELIVAK